MRVALVWDDEAESVVRWPFAGVIGITDYIISMNETVASAIMSGHEAIDCVVNMGWRMPFPNRAFK